jgi:1-aminocyclopropane-1-carboxylate deaminase/D-cysteine desulfhydrase-like pyridoxal-dependent ACC family enzyme
MNQVAPFLGEVRLANDDQYRYYDMTPVELHDGCFLKRDDLYQPFSDFGISGGKVRQCLYLVQSNIETIVNDCAGTIATAASVYSPQATIVARIAREFGLRCIIGVGTDKPLKHKAMQMCADMGAEMVTLVRHNAYNSVLYGKLAELNKTRKFFTINFGYQALTNPEAIIEMNANQVKNLPQRLDFLVINVGSGVSASGILQGLARYRPDIAQHQIHLIQPFGYDRRKVISAGLHFENALYHYHQGNYPYHKALNVDVGSVHLDEVYEAKAFEFMTKHIIDPKKHNRRVCYWLVGDSNILRR